MEKQSKLLTLGAGMASMAAILGGSVFMAQGSSASAASADSTGAYSASVGVANHVAGADHAGYITALAAKLGISETQLTDALKSVQLDQIAQAVTAGTMTQAQADAAIARINAGEVALFGFGGGRGHEGGPRGGSGHGVDKAALATFLGVDATALNTALSGGKSLATVASENGKSRDELKAFLTSQLTTSLQAAVTAGTLTQAQADAKLAEHTANLDARIDQVGGKGGRGHAGPGMMRPAAGA